MTVFDILDKLSLVSCKVPNRIVWEVPSLILIEQKTKKTLIETQDTEKFYMQDEKIKAIYEKKVKKIVVKKNKISVYY